MSAVQIKKAGAFIAPLLKTHLEGKVIGITSKGVFILLGRKVVFLTNLSFDNPFSLYIDDPADFPQGVGLNAVVLLSDRHLRIGEWQAEISPLVEITPDPLPQVKAHALKGTVVAQIVSIFQMLDRAGHEDSCLFVIDGLLKKCAPSDAAKQSQWDAMQTLRVATREKNLAGCEEALKWFLGNGKGLTPSGDDFVAGYLLVLNSLVDPEGNVDEFTLRLNALATEMAHKRTTWISANLIEAATRRLVDERVGEAAMVLLNTCKMDPVTVAQNLESFGSSSGIDAFSGMAAALLPD